MIPRFYLGTHETAWLERTERPLFISRRRLQRRKRMPVAAGRWALDSGGFTELSLYGRWTLSAADYADMVERYATEVGGLDFAAPQDWMCEPHMLERTELSIAEHQSRTVGNFLELRDLAPHLPIIPVLQGWTLEDYLACLDLYRQAGVDLTAEPVVGIGSVCRRQGTNEIAFLVGEMARRGLRLHGFGVKTQGLGRFGYLLASADSLAWSYQARKNPPLPECTHQSCANCLLYATAWRDRLIERLERTGVQFSLFDGVAA